jgi:hypothetical protein
MDLIACPEPSCDLPAEILERVLIDSTDLPIEHARIACLRGHRFYMPLEMPAPSDVPRPPGAPTAQERRPNSRTPRLGVQLRD